MNSSELDRLFMTAMPLWMPWISNPPGAHACSRSASMLISRSGWLSSSIEMHHAWV